MSKTNKNDKPKLFDYLKSRELVYQTSDPKIEEILNGDERVTLYLGIDPTANSLHIGYLVALRVLNIIQAYGHRVILLLGGATSQIGDPTDKKSTRIKLTTEIVEKNLESIKNQVESAGFLVLDGEKGVMVNNANWLNTKTFLGDFLSDIATQFSVADLLSMSTFSKRLEENKPLALSEFCYPVMQSWDFLHLYETEGCTLQVGGSDQWGNIVRGVDLVRKKTGASAYALTWPLLEDENGTKMGKSVGKPVWLDAQKTTPLEMYQYVQKFPDTILKTSFLRLTDLSLKEIEQIMKNPREAQLRLAYEVVKVVHGEETAKLAAGDFKELAVGEAESAIIPEFVNEDYPVSVVDVLVYSGALPSKSEARRRISQGGVRLMDGNDEGKGTLVENEEATIERPVVIKYGKNSQIRIL